MNILIAEDNEEIVEYILAVFEDHEDFNFRVASNGDEAIGFLKKEPNVFDLVLSDFNMPIKNGIDVYNFIVENNIPIPMVIMSATIGLQQLKALSDFKDNNPLNRFVSKPFGKNEIFNILNKYRFTLLIVDAEQTSLSTFQKILSERGGLKFKTAANYDEALDIIENENINLAFIDVSHEKSGGKELIVTIRKKVLPIKIIVLSDNKNESSNDLKNFLKENNLTTILNRPFSLDEILPLVHRILCEAN